MVTGASARECGREDAKVPGRSPPPPPHFRGLSKLSVESTRLEPEWQSLEAVVGKTCAAAGVLRRKRVFAGCCFWVCRPLHVYLCAP